MCTAAPPPQRTISSEPAVPTDYCASVGVISSLDDSHAELSHLIDRGGVYPAPSSVNTMFRCAFGIRRRLPGQRLDDQRFPRSLQSFSVMCFGFAAKLCITDAVWRLTFEGATEDLPFHACTLLKFGLYQAPAWPPRHRLVTEAGQTGRQGAPVGRDTPISG